MADAKNGVPTVGVFVGTPHGASAAPIYRHATMGEQVFSITSLSIAVHIILTELPSPWQDLFLSFPGK
ncbi:MAG: hypothetical protein IT320_16785 [Anaerolineae bacterium]|nr:hypothetical protein [Anaerolineae bacterium]